MLPEQNQRQNNTYQQTYNYIELGYIEYEQHGQYRNYRDNPSGSVIDVVYTSDLIRPLEVFISETCLFRGVLHEEHNGNCHDGCAGKSRKKSCI